MVTDALTRPVSLTMNRPLFDSLYDHLFPGDGDEHGAVILAGIASSRRGTRLLARDVVIAKDGADYIPSRRGYRQLTPEFVLRVSDQCAKENLCYLAVHCHGGTDSVAFSRVDLDSHERGYPALIDITHGGPVGAVVLARNAVAGDIWTTHGRYELEHLTIVGPKIVRMYSDATRRPPKASLIFDRHVRLFGDAGQAIFSELKVGIIGLGGGGSLLNEWLSRLGVGHIVAVDFDRLDVTNLPRVVGATRWDAHTSLARSRSPLVRRMAKGTARYKVDIAKRVARKANPYIKYEAIVGNVMDKTTARQLTDVDFLFLASDTMLRSCQTITERITSGAFWMDGIVPIPVKAMMLQLDC